MRCTSSIKSNGHCFKVLALALSAPKLISLDTIFIVSVPLLTINSSCGLEMNPVKILVGLVFNDLNSNVPFVAR